MAHLRGDRNSTIRKRQLRQEMTIAEQRLWTQVRNRALLGYKFRRQHGVGPYIVDFYCAAKNLVIEIDGDAHSGEKAYQHDIKRTVYLENLGLQVVRYSNADVITNMTTVLEDIITHLNK